MHDGMFDDRAATSSSRTRLLAFGGLGLTLLGVVGYFVVVLRFGAALPRVRNDAVPNWILIEMGLVLSAFGIATAGHGRRGLPMALTALNVLVAGAFAGLLYDFTAVPPASGPSLGIAAPCPADFAQLTRCGVVLAPPSKKKRESSVRRKRCD